MIGLWKKNVIGGCQVGFMWCFSLEGLVKQAALLKKCSCRSDFFILFAVHIAKLKTKEGMYKKNT